MDNQEKIINQLKEENTSLKSIIIDQLSGGEFLTVYYVLIEAFKDIYLAVYFSFLISWSKMTKRKYNTEWFFLTKQKLDESIRFEIFGRSKRTQMDKKLESLGLISTKFEGIPRKKYYRINYTTSFNFLPYECRKRLYMSAENEPYNNKYITKTKSFSYEKDLVGCASATHRITSSPNNPRKLKRRKITPVDQVINYWSSIGPPLAEVRKPDSIKPILNKLLKKDKPREIIKVIERSIEYFENPLFKFKTNGNFGIKTFFKRDSYSLGSEFLRLNRASSWYFIFKLKGDTWLKENLFKIPSSVDPELQSALERILQVKDNEIESKSAIISGSNNMLKFIKLNKYPRKTILFDFQNFIKENYPDIRDFKIFWLKSSKFWNTRFAKYLVNYGRFKNIGEVKEI